MARKRYPLETARTLRRSQELAAQALVAERRSELDRAEAELSRAARAEREHQRVTVTFHRQSQTPAAGCSAGELERRAAYRRRLSNRAKSLRSATLAAEQHCQRRRKALAEAQQILAQARAAHSVVERHCEQFHAQQKKEEEKRNETEAEEAHAAHRSTPGRQTPF